MHDFGKLGENRLELVNAGVQGGCILKVQI